MYQRKHPFRALARHGTSRGKENDAPIDPIPQVYESMISHAYGRATTPLEPLSFDDKVDRVLCKLDNMSRSMDTLGENVGLLVELQCQAALAEAMFVDPANAEYYSHFVSGQSRLRLEFRSLADLGSYLQLDDKEVTAACMHVMNGFDAKSCRVILEAFMRKAYSDIINIRNRKSKERCLVSMETFQALLYGCKDILLAWNLAAAARRVLKVYGQSSKYIKFIFPVIEEAMKVLTEVHVCAESLSVNAQSVFPFAFLAYQARNELVSRLEIDLAGDCIRKGADFAVTLGEIKATKTRSSLQKARFQVDSVRKMVLIMLRGIQEEMGSSFKLKQFRSLLVFGRHGDINYSEECEKSTNIEHGIHVGELVVYLRQRVY